MNKTPIQESLERFDELCNSLAIKDFLDLEFDTKVKDFLSNELALAEQRGKEERERIFSVIKPVFEDWAVQSQYITGSWLHGNPTAWEQFSKQFDNKLANTEIKQSFSSTEQGEKQLPHEHKSNGMVCLVAHTNHKQCSKCSICGEWY